MVPHPGQFVQLDGDLDSHFQVIAVDAAKGSSWIRRWPIARNGSPPFSVAISKLRSLNLVAA